MDSGSFQNRNSLYDMQSLCQCLFRIKFGNNVFIFNEIMTKFLFRLTKFHCIVLQTILYMKYLFILFMYARGCVPRV